MPLFVSIDGFISLIVESETGSGLLTWISFFFILSSGPFCSACVVYSFNTGFIKSDMEMRIKHRRQRDTVL